MKLRDLKAACRRRWLFTALACSAAAVIACPAHARTAAEINAAADKTLEQFYASVGGAKEFSRSAKALLVMSDVTKAGFIAGGEYGQGALRVGGKTAAYYNIVSGSLGFTFGAQKMDIILAFMTQDALDRFRKFDGWEVGVDGNVAIIDMGGGKRLNTTTLNDPVVGFVFDPKGLMVDVSLKGAKFTKITK